MRTKMTLAAAVVLALLAGCGDSDDDGAPTTGAAVESAVDGSPDAERPDTEGADTEVDGSDGDTTAGGSGSLVLDGDTIELTQVRCHLEAQDAAAGGGRILFVGQGRGVDADGEDVLLDVSRYDEESQFEGDMITLDIGDFTSEDAVNLTSTSPIGTVTVDGGSMRADDLEFEDYVQGGQRTASFELTC